MRHIDFENEHPYDDDKIVIPVRFVQPPLFQVEMILDTGARISTLSMSMFDVLGIGDVESGRRGSITVANGDAAACWIHPVEIELLGRRLTTDVAFTPGWRIRNLLGMRGFMDQMVFAVDHAEHTLHVQWR